MENLRDDIVLVQNVRRNAVSESFTVGAVVKSKNGRKFTGCNVEIGNEAISAEKVAILKALTEGEREFDYIVVTGGKKSNLAEKYLPSEESKKFMKNLVEKDFKIYTIYENKIEEYSL